MLHWCLQHVTHTLGCTSSTKRQRTASGGGGGEGLGIVYEEQPSVVREDSYLQRLNAPHHLYLQRLHAPITYTYSVYTPSSLILTAFTRPHHLCLQPVVREDEDEAAVGTATFPRGERLHTLHSTACIRCSNSGGGQLHHPSLTPPHAYAVPIVEVDSCTTPFTLAHAYAVPIVDRWTAAPPPSLHCTHTLFQ